jgi:hypothetical protein
LFFFILNQDYRHFLILSSFHFQGNYHVFPSEGGMAEVFCPKSATEWELLSYLESLTPGEKFVIVS